MSLIQCSTESQTFFMNDANFMGSIFDKAYAPDII